MTEAAASITVRSGSLSSKRGSSNAASIEPPPNAASVIATSRWPSPSAACTSTGVLTITIALAAAAASVTASSPRSRGVLR
jgi:hypothetical protein